MFVDAAINLAVRRYRGSDRAVDLLRRELIGDLMSADARLGIMCLISSSTRGVGYEA